MRAFCESLRREGESFSHMDERWRTLADPNTPCEIGISEQTKSKKHLLNFGVCRLVLFVVRIFTAQLRSDKWGEIEHICVRVST